MSYFAAIKFEDENGEPYGIKHLNNKPRVVANDYLLEIKQRNILGHVPVDMFGSNRNVPIGPTEDTLWIKTGVYKYLTATEILKTASSAAADVGTVVTSGNATGGSTTTLIDTGATFITNGVAILDIVLNDAKDIYGIVKSVDSEIQLTIELPTEVPTVSGDAYRIVTFGGAGAAVVCIQGLIAGYVDAINFIVLNGATPVTSTSSFLRVNRSFVIGNQKNVGDIDVSNNAVTDVLARIAVGNNQTLQAVFTVPAGKDFNLLEWYASSINAKDTNFFIYIREIGDAFKVKRVSGVKDDHFRLPLIMLGKIPEKTDIEMRVFGEQAGGIVFGGFWGWLE